MGTHPIFESDFDCLTENIKMNTTADLVSEMHGDDLEAMSITDYAIRHYKNTKGLNSEDAKIKFEGLKNKRKINMHILHRRTTLESLTNKEEEINESAQQEYIDTGYWYFLEDDEDTSLKSVQEAKDTAKKRYNKKLNLLEKYFIWKSKKNFKLNEKLKEKNNQLEMRLEVLDQKYNTMADASKKLKKNSEKIAKENGMLKKENERLKTMTVVPCSVEEVSTNTFVKLEEKGASSPKKRKSEKSGLKKKKKKKKKKK